MNKVVLIGRNCKEVEISVIKNSMAMAKFTIAVDRFKKGETDFINIIAFGKVAEYIGNYLKKGKLVAISGKIQTGSYEAKDGSKRYTTDIVADEVKILEWGEKKENNSSGYSDMTPIDSGDIPF